MRYDKAVLVFLFNLEMPGDSLVNVAYSITWPYRPEQVGRGG